LAFIRATQPETLQRLEGDYGSDAPMEIIRALKEQTVKSPLWVILRNGLTVRGHHFHLYGPKPRSGESAANRYYAENRITFKTELVIDEAKRPDIVLFLNGLPIIVIELKHEASNQNVHDAVAQFNQRNHADRIFQLPFLYIAADTSDVKVATDPRREQNFRWYNTGLENQPLTEGEYPVEYLYREVLALDAILEAISFFLIYVPKREAVDDKPERSAFSIFPRYHQSRMVRRVADDALAHFSQNSNLGKKYLIDHSAGSGKTLSISWLADRLHSLYKPGSYEKTVEMIFILTDRKSLDKNIRDELVNFSHLAGVIKFAKKSQDLARYIQKRESIIVTTQQKFVRILEILEQDESLRQLRVAYLIDEAHRSQENKMGTSIRTPFRQKSADEPDEEGIEEDKADPQEEINKILRAHDHNQLFVAFTATPSNATVQLFGDAFDTYSEAEAIQEGYIVDVAASIISYETLYHLQSPVVPAEDKKLYPAGVISKALKNVAFQDEGLIQYKAEVMLRIFDEQVRPLIDGRAKAMIVTSSRLAGLSYYNILKEKLREKHAAEPERFNYKVLYAFSDFVHPDTNKVIRETDVNGLKAEELIEDRFKGDDYRLMVVASKFQTGFDQPLLAGMFLDKPVYDRNAVQTISRLNRCHDDKENVVVVDFTNNADAILKAFNKYRKGTPYETSEPDKEQCVELYREIVGKGLFTDVDSNEYLKLLYDSAPDGWVQAEVTIWRGRFNNQFTELDERKAFVYLLTKFVKSFHFLACFFEYSEEIGRFATFADFIGPQLIKQGTVTDLMKHIRKVELTKAAVKFLGVKEIQQQTIKTRPGGKGGGQPPRKVTITDMIEKLKEQFEISEEEALVIKDVCEEKIADPIIASNIQSHRDDMSYLQVHYKPQVRVSIEGSYEDRGLYERLIDPKYADEGSIFDTMAFTVIQAGVEMRVTS
jgi:type I restriction enzyme R subunit